MLERDYMETEVKEEVKAEKKSKKGLLITLIVICTVLFVGLSSLLTYLIINKDKHISFIPVKKITITFNVDGGTKVEKITFKKGTFVELPSSTKEGYEFKGWIVEKLNKNSKEFYEVGSPLSDYWTRFLEDDITVKANWEAKSEAGKSMTIYFDAKGGKIAGNNSNDSQSLVPCTDNAYTVEGLPTATKEGYTFVAWVDSHETPILEGASLVCEDINLYANWTKEEEKWTCESGDGPDANHKCKLYMTPDKRCPSGTTEYKGSCINKNVVTTGNSNHDKVVRICGKSTVIMDNNGHTAEVQGDLAWVGDSYENAQYYYCAYGATTESKSECTTTGHKWIGVLNKCYRSTTDPGKNMTFSCSQNDLVFLSINDVRTVTQNNNASIYGCFKTTARESYCSDSSYTLNGEYCTKMVDAKKVD